MTRGMSIDPVEAGHSHRLIEAKRLVSKITGMLQLAGTAIANPCVHLFWLSDKWLVYNKKTSSTVYADNDLSAAIDAFIIASSI